MENPFLNKEGKVSKTKVAAFLGGLSAVLGTIAGILNGNISGLSGLQTLATELAVILGLFGIRDLKIFN